MNDTDLEFLLHKHIPEENYDFIFLNPINIKATRNIRYYIAQTPLLKDFTTLEDLEQTLVSEGNDNEEYVYFPDFDADLIARMMSKGLFPMSIKILDYQFPIMRHHNYKCVIPLQHNSTFTYHKSIRRYVRKMPNLTLCFDKDFFGVINGIETAYSDEGTWLAEALVAAYKTIFDNNDNNKYPVKIHSVEVYDEDKLVAGEIGFISGDVYTSLTGFHSVPNTGSIQMAALGTYLMANGFSDWDLGMQIDYKYDYGSLNADREAQKYIYRDCPKKCRPLTYDTIVIKDLLNVK